VDEKALNEAIGFVCLLSVVFIVMGIVIVWVLPAVFPFFQQNGANQNGWWLVVFGAIGIISSCLGGTGGTRRHRASQETGSTLAGDDPVKP
jgi:H+/Cl- antiporter ClcA